jgi:hypothetical protein
VVQVKVCDRAFDYVKPGRRPRRTVTCSYDDGGATGTVVVEHDRRFDRPDRRGD